MPDRIRSFIKDDKKPLTRKVIKTDGPAIRKVIRDDRIVTKKVIKDGNTPLVRKVVKT